MIPTAIRRACTALLCVLAGAGLTAQRSIGDSNPNGYVDPFLSPFVPFAANDHIGGQELWRTDGTATNTFQIADIRPGGLGSRPSGFLLRGTTGEWYFAADDGSAGREPWKTDGTGPGTVAVADIAPGAAGSNPTDFTNAGGLVFFVADDGAHGRELWRTDGTAIGTQIARDIRTGALGAEPRELTAFQGLLYFTADDGANGRELWRSDGTATGTVLVRDFTPSGSSNPTELVEHRGLLFFAANSAGTGRELFFSNGTVAGTGVFVDIRPGGASSAPTQLVGGAFLYFVADDGVHGRELWRSNGTPAGTALVQDINPGAASSEIENLTHGPGLFDYRFVADDGSTGREPWQVVINGAARIADIVPGPGHVGPTQLQPVRGTPFSVFRGTDAAGNELWVTDGTAAGTGLLLDIWPGSRDSFITGITPVTAIPYPVNFGALFVANDGSNGIELWRTDGTPTNTVMIADIANDLVTSQPTLTPHGVGGPGGIVDLCIEGQPSGLGVIALDLVLGPGLVIPGITGVYLLGPTPVAQVVLLDATGTGCVALAIPAAPFSIGIFAQALEILFSGPAGQLSDLAVISITDLPSSTLGGPVTSVGAYDDKNHLYDVVIDLPPSTPASGKLVFHNLANDEEYSPDEGGDYSSDLGLRLHIAGNLPEGWDAQVELYFVDEGGKSHLLWRSYC